MPVILATWEAEIRRVTVQSQPIQFKANSLRGPISKKTYHKKRAGRVAEGVSIEFKPQYHKKQTNKKKLRFSSSLA
jgi:hypothetical protein